MSLLKGNYDLKKNVEAKKDENENLESKFEREAMKHLGGSIAFVKKKKVAWDLNKPNQK